MLSKQIQILDKYIFKVVHRESVGSRMREDGGLGGEGENHEEEIGEGTSRGSREGGVGEVKEAR